MKLEQTFTSTRAPSKFPLSLSLFEFTPALVSFLFQFFMTRSEDEDKPLKTKDSFVYTTYVQPRRFFIIGCLLALVFILVYIGYTVRWLRLDCFSRWCRTGFLRARSSASQVIRWWHLAAAAIYFRFSPRLFLFLFELSFSVISFSFHLLATIHRHGWKGDAAVSRNVANCCRCSLRVCISSA